MPSYAGFYQTKHLDARLREHDGIMEASLVVYRRDEEFMKARKA